MPGPVILRFAEDLRLADNPAVDAAVASGGPVIPVCTAAQRNDPQALCSLGPILVQGAFARAT